MRLLGATHPDPKYLVDKEKAWCMEILHNGHMDTTPFSDVSHLKSGVTVLQIFSFSIWYEMCFWNTMVDSIS